MEGNQFKYETIAGNIRDAIMLGSLHTGDKLPSIRQTSRELGVSNASVFKAYYHLESEGLIECKPKSGYYVKYHVQDTQPPSRQLFNQDACEVSNRALIHDFIAAKLANPHHLDLGTAVPSTELLPISGIKKSIQRSYLDDPQAATAYENTTGHPGLKRSICHFGLNWGRVITENEVVITNGCMEAIAMSLSILTQPGDTIALESPAYYGLLQMIEHLKLRIIEIPADSTTGISIDDLEQALRDQAIKAILVVPNFNNPTGSLVPDENKRRLVAMASAYQVPIIEDDIYGELYFSEHRPKNCKSFDEDGWVIYCSSFSKTLAPGFRVGWCLPGRFYEDFVQKKYVTNISTSSISQAVIAHFLTHGRYDFYLKKLRSALKTQHLQYKRAIFDYFPGKIASSNPQGGFVLWLELPKSKNALALYQAGVKAGIIIAPGQMFFARADYQNYFRISYGKPFSEAVDEALKKLGRLAGSA
ncbi:PLP-dependent aminotransferase family protein [Marinoscillum sp.]|uniref:aminotransferase-like domain-containing protein n=1 Tax=Marinoscillum sp. TaxID=2024838 RepID=UPI003BAD2374